MDLKFLKLFVFLLKIIKNSKSASEKRQNDETPLPKRGLTTFNKIQGKESSFVV